MNTNIYDDMIMLLQEVEETEENNWEKNFNSSSSSCCDNHPSENRSNALNATIANYTATATAGMLSQALLFLFSYLSYQTLLKSMEL